jgi:deoxyadenosine/deoxycytidine kinase
MDTVLSEDISLRDAGSRAGPRDMSQGYFLAIAGNIGVGKTELTNRLSAELGWLAYYEPVIHNPYLDAFYADMSRWSFHLQIYFLSERFKAQVQIGDSALPFIQDRTIYEDAEIFARTLHDQGSMSDVDYENYVSLFQILVSFLRKPDLIIYLKASPASLMKRIARAGGRASRDRIDYITRLNDAYDDWMRRARVECEVLRDRHRPGAAAGRDRRLPRPGQRPQAPLPAASRAEARPLRTAPF